MIHSDHPLCVSAPGKMMICGEYAVLDGAEAIVAAVDRRAYASLRAAGGPSPAPEVQAAFREAQARVGHIEGDISLDVSSMRSDGIKIGLGSSAAGAVAAAGLVYEQRGLTLVEPVNRDAVMRAALAGHHAVAPKGSGADVAAAALGGFIRFRRLGDTVETHSLAWPTRVEMRVVWTGQEARTSDFVAKVDALKAQAPATYRKVMSGLGRESDAFVSAVISGDISAMVECTDAYGQAMGELGRAAGIGIVTESLAKTAEVARQAGGAAKPSGAGGGDVAIGIFPDREAAERFERLCIAAGLRLLSIQLGAPGVRLEAPHGQSEAA